MKKVWALTSFIVLILGFQNCSQSTLQQSGTLGSSVTVSVPLNSGVGSSDSPQSASEPAQVTYVEIPGVQDVSTVSQKIEGEGEGIDTRLVISLQSGKIQLMDSANNILQNRCLKAEELSELKTILAGSQVCEAQVASDSICSMRVKSAYASLYANEKRVPLGEERDSCGRGRKDLCGSLASVFQAYVSHVKASWANMSCE